MPTFIKVLFLEIFVLFLSFQSYSQSEILNNPELIKLNSLLRKHARNSDSLSFYANQMLVYSKKKNLKFWEYSANVFLGNSERTNGNILKSNDFYYEALTIAKSIDDAKAQSMVINNIALNHRRLSRNDSAYFYFKKLETYHTNQQEVLSASMAKMNIGLTFFQYQELDSTAHYLNQSLKGFNELNNHRFIAQNLNLLGELLFQKDDIKKAIEYVNSSLELAKEHDLKFILPTNYSLLSRIYRKNGNLEKSKEYATMAANLRPKKIDFSESQINTLNEEIRIQKAKDYQLRLNDVKESKQFYQSNLFTAIALIIVLLFLLYFFYKRHIAIENEFKEMQNKLTKSRDVKTKNENDIDKKVIQLKSKASINCATILYIKSDGHYVEYYLDDRKNPEMDRSTMLDVLKNLPSNSFVRIHKSYIVNIHRVKIINSNKLMLDTGEWINLSRTYKQELKDLLYKG